jgi:hypothetical protein
MVDNRDANLDATIRRMAHMLEVGAWPSGLELSPSDRQLIAWNLDIARNEREQRAARVAHELAEFGIGLPGGTRART